MASIIVLVAVVVLSTIYGLWFTKNQGKVKVHHSVGITEHEIGGELGSRLTLLQFSSAFCMPCKATRALLQNISQGLDDVNHVEVDAESHLDLVRKLGVMSTPTTIILDSNGNEIGRAVGAPKRDQVLDAISPISI